MPSNLPSSFASAAAGNGSGTPSQRTPSRRDTLATTDWSQRPNGATQTFRRAPASGNIQNRDTNVASQGHNTAPSAGTYVPPPTSANRHSNVNTRYSRELLLTLFQEQRETEDLSGNLADLYAGENDTNDHFDPANKKWGRRDDGPNESAIGPEVCLNNSSTTEPLVLYGMTDEEKELFTSSVNSPLKAPNPTSGKEGLARDPASNRKTSFSQNYAAGLTSPGVARPPPRRREQSESFAFPKESVSSPSANAKSFRDDQSSMPPAALLRRRTDHKESDSANRSANMDYKQASNEISSGPRRESSGPLSPNVHDSQPPWTQFSGPFAGLGQPMNAVNNPAGQPKRPTSGLQRAESRFRGLMGRETSGSTSAARLKEQNSLGSFGNPQDMETDQHRFGNDEASVGYGGFGTYDASIRQQKAVGSAALGGANDDNPSDAQFLSGLGASHNQQLAGNSGFSFPVNADTSIHRGRGSYASFLPNTQTAGEPSSPTLTNPYQSPERGLPSLNEEDGRASDVNQFHLPGLGDFGGESSELPRTGMNARMSNAHENISTGLSQTSQRGMPQRFPSLSGLSGLSGRGNTGSQWSAGFGLGTPSHERQFDNFFDSSRHNADDGNAELSGLGTFPPHSSTLGTASTGDATSTTRGSNLGSLFPTGMHDQMRGADHNNFKGSNAELRKSSLTADDGSDSFRPVHRSSTFSNHIGSIGDDMSIPGNRGQLSELSQRHERGEFISIPPSQFPPIGNQTAWASQPPPQQQFQQSAALTASSSQIPAAQQKQMVMPDRIRWIYRDPQGNTQGPWSGLEMHDWYKAGFFSPELLVKKAEDAEYEPLAQLIRRIGNSREPFLVPQIGIPAPESSHRGANWPTQNAQSTSASINPPAAQPPFANSFPSFGTTLTAEQQNALERRKQEEQYLMARQKEHLAHQQVVAKQMQMQGPHGPLQHHSSAQSLHSQPSFSSITSPGGFPSALPGPVQPNQYEAAFGPGSNFGPGPSAPGLEGLSNIKDQESSHFMQRLSIGHGTSVPFPSGSWQQGSDNSVDSQRAAGLAERARLQAQQAEADQEQNLSGDHGDDLRLRQFHELRGESSRENMNEMIGRYAAEAQAQAQAQRSEGFGQGDEQDMQARLHEQQAQGSVPKSTFRPMQPQEQTLSLTEQVQKVASVKQSPANANDYSYSNKIERPLAESHPPSQPSSPLPAPAARRGPTHSVAEALAAESASQSASPVADTPTASLAPWAKESSESQKQPSLKKIQEAEARRVAKQEEAAAAARRAAAEREVAPQPAPPAPALPSSSTWGSSDTGASVPTQSPWAKASSSKTQGSINSTKKTLQQIQKEEEALARKQKVVNAVGSNVAAGTAHSLTGQPSPGGKRYADLASKTAANQSSISSAWTTVGAGGKTKTPAPSSTPTGAPKQATAPPPGIPVVPKSKFPAPSGKPAVASNVSSPVEEFKKWAASKLRGDLSKGIEVDDFVNALYSLPPDNNLITEAVHSSSSTMDSRHFAEEFIRRRALADRGKSQPVNTGTTSGATDENKNGGGWNEVLRRPPVSNGKDESQSFKVVPTKKKGGKK